MSVSSDRVRRAWPLGNGTVLRERIVAAYEQPWRRYHDVRHLDEVLARIAEICSATTISAEQEEIVTLAGYFHDVVYRPDPPDGISNEEQSARLAEAWLSSAGLDPDVVTEVARLVRGTQTHDSAPQDVAAHVLYDADLGILAADPDRYAQYVRDVRAEYAEVPDQQFAQGRSAVLESLLRRPAVFATPYGRDRWEAAARENVEQELLLLRAQT
ncbi:HD domain-containing protein [Luteipulveratus flavus]|uniref:Metal-dependent phosphohydrolase n=1 Tax=Luteipulveratus flavus TaxID=3031728 RepID=A0ABT6C8X2_9MICO|nr:hypothetical protein [Luteipulveratus sp. YIM 133296]MDF8265240.1 hypothetical protein [Luteipulveratus sp. YIM 133296]